MFTMDQGHTPDQGVCRLRRIKARSGMACHIDLNWRILRKRMPKVKICAPREGLVCFQGIVAYKNPWRTALVRYRREATPSLSGVQVVVEQLNHRKADPSVERADGRAVLRTLTFVSTDSHARTAGSRLLQSCWQHMSATAWRFLWRGASRGRNRRFRCPSKRTGSRGDGHRGTARAGEPAITTR
jgi:hypothetical protein